VQGLQKQAASHFASAQNSLQASLAHASTMEQKLALLTQVCMCA
jgi:hypothetical protein